MTFGTTIRARALNALPLRQRSISVPWLGITDAADLWGEREVLAISAFLDVAHDAPGWDADGRPVASPGGANMATQQDIDNLITSVNATSTALEVLATTYNSGNLVKAEDVTRVSEKLVAMVTKLGEYTARGP